jgi:hypothetical protein
LYLLATLAGILSWPGIARAATPVDELLRFVPPDVGFCVIARDLRGHGQALADSPFVAALRKTAAGEAIAHGEEFGRLEKLQEQLHKQLGIDAHKLLDDIFGDGIAFAYRPGPPGKPEEEAGLILIRARAAKPIAELVMHLNEVQKANGEVTGIEERTRRGITYFCRLERDKPPSFYYLRGPVFLLSGNEALLLQALDLERATAADAEPAVSRELRLLGADRAVLALWLNPRAFDRHIAERAKCAGPDAAGLKTMERYWGAFDSGALSLVLDKDLTLSMTLRGRAEQLPAAARRWFAEAAQPSDLWQAFPESPLIAAARRSDMPALMEMVSEFLPGDGRQAMAGELNRSLGSPLGKDIVKEVLPCIGPDFGFYLQAPPPGDKAWFVQGLAAVKIGAGDPAAPVDRAILAGLHSAAVVAVVVHNAKDPKHPITLKSGTQDKREFRYLTGEGVFPPGLQPAFGLHSGYLVVATSPETLSRFAPAPAPPSRPGEPTPLLRVGLKEWRQYLKGHLEAIAGAIAEEDGVTPELARAKLNGVISTLELFDRIDVYQRTAPGQIAFTLRLQTAQPLRK